MREIVRRHERGLTMVELLIALAILMIAALIGYPALQKTLARANLEGAAQQMMALMRAGRLEAIKRSAPAVVTLDQATGRLMVFIDIHDAGGVAKPDLLYNPKAGENPANTDYIVGELAMPPRVNLGGPAAQPEIVKDFTDIGAGPRAVFQGDGSVKDGGAFRIRDDRQNFLEIKVAPAATARIQLRKWHTTDNDWFTRDMRNGKVLWEWY